MAVLVRTGRNSFQEGIRSPIWKALRTSFWFQFDRTLGVDKTLEQLGTILAKRSRCCLLVVHESDMGRAIIDVAGHRALLRVSIESHQHGQL